MYVMSLSWDLDYKWFCEISHHSFFPAEMAYVFLVANSGIESITGAKGGKIPRTALPACTVANYCDLFKIQRCQRSVWSSILHVHNLLMCVLASSASTPPPLHPSLGELLASSHAYLMQRSWTCMHKYLAINVLFIIHVKLDHVWPKYYPITMANVETFSLSLSVQ